MPKSSIDMAKRLETPRLVLEPCTSAHLMGFHRIWSNPQSASWSLRGPCQTLEQSKDWMAGILNDSTKPDLFSWAVCPLEHENEVIGIITVKPSDQSSQMFGTSCLDIGYIFYPTSWGNGYATEAMDAAIESVRGDIKSRTLVAWVNPNNTASLNVARKCKFEMAKHFKGDKDKLFIGGEWRDDECYIFARHIESD